MRISEMIAELQTAHRLYGDLEVTITDGYKGYFYKGDFDITVFQPYVDEPEFYLDIGIGECECEE